MKPNRRQKRESWFRNHPSIFHVHHLNISLFGVRALFANLFFLTPYWWIASLESTIFFQLRDGRGI